uniref:Uncharacterized protein n=1 Tax=Setaria viridis TaxID=4556 RepID=A0A4U6UHW3_SETVI|nr:hypothetical protein SEVIR_5G158966v2 [Setaria viridis]
MAEATAVAPSALALSKIRAGYGRCHTSSGGTLQASLHRYHGIHLIFLSHSPMSSTMTATPSPSSTSPCRLLPPSAGQARRLSRGAQGRRRCGRAASQVQMRSAVTRRSRSLAHPQKTSPTARRHCSTAEELLVITEGSNAPFSMRNQAHGYIAR